MSDVLIIGNGPAAHRLAERLHHHGHSGAITVLGAEPRPAYNRILLGSVLDHTLTASAVTLPELPEGVRVELGVTVTEIDTAEKLARTDDGQTHHYDELVLATGARARIPDTPGVLTGADEYADGVVTMRTLDDCERINDSAANAVVLGGGILGVEVARGLQGRGVEVTLVHPKPYPMDRQLDPVGGRMLTSSLNDLGARTRLDRKAVAYEPGKLTLDDGEVLAADVLVLCTGVVPETELAEPAGLAVGRGVVVDDRLGTSDPHVHALGDCAEHRGDVPGLIAPAWDQAEVLAQVLTGAQARYSGTSTVTRLKARGIDLASIGSVAALDSPDAELVTLSDPARGRYAKLALQDERVTGAVLLGFPQAIASISQLHDRDLPVPFDRLGLLLGTATAESSAPTEVPADSVVCRCNNVTKKALIRAFDNGAREVADLAKATRATTGCGGCTDDVRRMCGSLKTNGSELTEQEGAA
ncbi:FAD-dependent oxidoreductase [Parasphingorhabdus pacifica]